MKGQGLTAPMGWFYMIVRGEGFFTIDSGMQAVVGTDSLSTFHDPKLRNCMKISAVSGVSSIVVEMMGSISKA